MKSGKFLPMESGIPLTIANRNPRSTDKESEVQYRNPESKTVLDSLTRGKSATNKREQRTRWALEGGGGEILTNSPDIPRLPTTPTNPGIPCLLIKNIF